MDIDSSDWTFPWLTHWDKAWLNRPVSSHEVYGVISHMGEHKALRLDCFPPYLFWQYWHILGDKVLSCLMYVLWRKTDPQLE